MTRQKIATVENLKNFINQFSVTSVNEKTGDVSIRARPPAIYVRHSSPDSTSGGNSSFTTQKYNDVRYNKINGASFDTSTHEMTLPAGEYYCESEQHPFQTRESSLRLFSLTSSSTLLRGNTVYASDDTAPCRVEGFFTLSQESTIVLQLVVDTSTSHIFGVSRNSSNPPSPMYAGKFYVEKL